MAVKPCAITPAFFQLSNSREYDIDYERACRAAEQTIADFQEAGLLQEDGL